jgi:hypothetical protein
MYKFISKLYEKKGSFHRYEANTKWVNIAKVPKCIEILSRFKDEK